MNDLLEVRAEAIGLGGHLFWTAVARELHDCTTLRLMPVEMWKSDRVRIVKSPIFDRNPHMVMGPADDYAKLLPLNDPATNYCKLDTSTHCVQRHDKHVVRQICEHYGFEPKSIDPELYLTQQELENVGELLYTQTRVVGSEPFITVEPCTKDEYTVNKTYPFEKWQRVVDELRHRIKIVQIGVPKSPRLRGIDSVVGSTTFREAAALQSQARLHLGAEGGLMHAARAVGTKSVVIVTGFLHPTMTCYPEDTVLWLGRAHGPCGMKVKCAQCAAECAAHDPQEIIEAVVKELGS